MLSLAGSWIILINICITCSYYENIYFALSFFRVSSWLSAIFGIVILTMSCIVWMPRNCGKNVKVYPIEELDKNANANNDSFGKDFKDYIRDYIDNDNIFKISNNDKMTRIKNTNVNKNVNSEDNIEIKTFNTNKIIISNANQTKQTNTTNQTISNNKIQIVKNPNKSINQSTYYNTNQNTFTNTTNQNLNQNNSNFNTTTVDKFNKSLATLPNNINSIKLPTYTKNLRQIERNLNEEEVKECYKNYLEHKQFKLQEKAKLQLKYKQVIKDQFK